METGVSPGWKQHGGLSITADEDRLKEFKLITLKILNSLEKLALTNHTVILPD